MGHLKVPVLRLELTKDGKSIKFTRADRPPEYIDCTVSEASSKRHRRSLRKGLNSLKKGVSYKDFTIEEAGAAFQDLNTRGTSILWEIFGEEGRPKAEKILRECFPDWDCTTNPSNIIVAADLNRFLPLELLPIFDSSRWTPIVSQRDLEHRVRRFPGFCAVIKREFTDPEEGVDQDLVLMNEPKLPIRCFVNKGFEGLPAAKQEYEFFKSLGLHIDLDGPWPPLAGLTGDEFGEQLANHLLFANQTFDGEPRIPKDQIQHFICDCIVDEDDVDESVLMLSRGNSIKIYQLQAQFAQAQSANEKITENRKQRPSPAPLIFLNACGSSRIDPMDVTSFPQLFLKLNKYRGFIGTETNVPDQFAADFSQLFYRGLLGGLTLGEAMYEAKWAMLRNKQNPLGIIYTTYADPNMRVSKKVKL